jgi:hypothetical protein
MNADERRLKKTLRPRNPLILEHAAFGNSSSAEVNY